ncbi:MAG: Gfo/Idh/MocA family protein, partial [Anaeroplasmataceae bacterium]
LHPEIGMYALEHGVHALLEKPAGVYTKQVQEVIDCAKKHPDLTFGVFFNQRMNPLYRKLKEIIANGEIGKLRRTNWIITNWYRPQAYYNMSDWRATWGGEGGGVLVNQAPHQIDLLQWLCGMPTKVTSNVQYGYKRNIATEDEVTALFEYEDGASGVFVTCTHDLVGTDRLEILGDKGKIVVEGSKTAYVTRLVKSEQEINAETKDLMAVYKLMMGGAVGGDNPLWSTETIEFPSAWGQQHADVLRNFSENIILGTPLVAQGADGINGVRIANAIHLSSWLGKQVDINFDADLFKSELDKKIAEEAKSKKA